MSKEDYYATLEIKRDASSEQIKKSYRKLAMKYHPDRNPNDPKAEEKFKKVSEAYEILSDPAKKQAYDMHGHAGVDPSVAAHGYAHASSNFSDVFGDIFGDIFGGGTHTETRGGGHYAQAGADLRYNLEIGFEEAIKGSNVELHLKTHVPCKHCSGTGSKPGSKHKACNTCAGQGQVRMQQGFFSIQQTCPTCHGQGQIIAEKCIVCYGQGRVEEEKTLSVKIPAGVDHGDRVRLTGEGEAGVNGGPFGDLYVQIHVKKHDIFVRDGINLSCKVPINMALAALGGEIEVPTLDGRIKLKIPAETQTGKVFRLRNKGVRSVKGYGPGDLFCKIIVETPVNLSRQQKKYLEEFQKSLNKADHKHTPQSGSWLKRVKHFIDEI